MLDKNLPEYKSILVEKKDNYAILTINRPEKRNCINYDVAIEMADALARLELDGKIFGVILQGAGDKAFCSGDDVNYDWSQYEFHHALAMRNLTKVKHRMLLALEEYAHPIIAAIDGYCLGGGMDIAMACDLRVGSMNSTFGMPEAILGFHDDWAGNKRLTNILGEATAKELYFLGEKFGAERAKEIGLITRIAPEHKALEVAEEMMQVVCSKAPMALQFGKIAIHHAHDMSEYAMMEMEMMMDGIVVDSKDAAEGLDAFFHKRKPQFTQY